MSTIQYLIPTNICLAVFLILYLVFLKKETFFQLNRAYLLISLLLSCAAPLIHINWGEKLTVIQQLQYSFLADPVQIFSDPYSDHPALTLPQIAFWVYVAGILIFSINLIIRLLAVREFIGKEKATSSYSFFKKIYLPEETLNNTLIREHENIHAAQWHSADIVLTELVVIFNWFNPAVYFLRRELKKVHEFIADEGALRHAESKHEYAMLLLSQTFETPINNLVNTFFNHKLLKQRIMMIQKNKSSRGVLLKYVLATPLFLLMLILSAATIANNTDKTAYNTSEPGTAITRENQSKVLPPVKDKVFTAVEIEPSFPGGVKAFQKFLSTHIKYPAEAKKKNIQGKVFINFIVEQNGALSNIKIMRDIGYGCGAEAVSVMKTSPKWKPGVQNGRRVRVSYTIPIAFTLNK